MVGVSDRILGMAATSSCNGLFERAAYVTGHGEMKQSVQSLRLET